VKTAGKIPASVSIIAYNEEDRIGRCLESVKDFAEVIVVVDEKTTDRTADICREFGCKVYIEQWKGFGPQKQSAIEKCTNDWVLTIDADEALMRETGVEIARSLVAPAADAYQFPRKNFLHGRWMKHGDWWPDFQVRLVRKSRGNFVSVVHERWESKGSVVTIDAPILHYPFSGYSEMIKTMNDYSTLIARDLFSRGVKANTFSPFVHGAGMFLKIYLFKRGFLDGIDGLVTAMLKAGGSFFKYAKLIELQRTDRP
jgi:glycosyltransferase involved in cell wall biosynthesis